MMGLKKKHRRHGMGAGRVSGVRVGGGGGGARAVIKKGAGRGGVLPRVGSVRGEEEGGRPCQQAGGGGVSEGY